MQWDPIQEKLEILAEAARYDVSCSSSGSKRANKSNGLGNSTGVGICHSYTEDGRCVSLLKILLTNHCIYDCAYCISRRSNDIPRAGFTVDEVVSLTINFYRRNYIEGLFLSSGIFKDADLTMERLVRVAKRLRTAERFNGYIHLKTIPGCSEELTHEAALYADRLSVNIELPTETSLKTLAPEKSHVDIMKPMAFVSENIRALASDKKIIKSTPNFAPAGQSTQMVVGASPENDLQVMSIADSLYKNYQLKRVYYSGYVPISNDNRLPVLGTPVPVIRENRLYQADWLTRFYQFSVKELVDPKNPNLDLDIDPKLSWALRNLDQFPVDVNTAPYEMILRVPGIGLNSAKKIVAARNFQKLGWEHLRKIGVAFNRAKHFVICQSSAMPKEVDARKLRAHILTQSKFGTSFSSQTSLFQ
ncbi:putative DNA modification/repair radical SAM protein [Pseudochryseolinea flava]|uniref:Putative DNA modification/repair radical SAM protein n=1 Tax=Pseudochryseolinea flava TaxID=2059302 RepID=A0A364XY09_9BACT|nr:putative DNA modification/repair radical SAM protein [Pseudochryseolinea flava]RAV98460.1 putative DNA modification/repair radical SAM protein [Pseudochryseolinea flava]